MPLVILGVHKFVAFYKEFTVSQYTGFNKVTQMNARKILVSCWIFPHSVMKMTFIIESMRWNDNLFLLNLLKYSLHKIPLESMVTSGKEKQDKLGWHCLCNVINLLACSKTGL